MRSRQQRTTKFNKEVRSWNDETNQGKAKKKKIVKGGNPIKEIQSVKRLNQS